MLMMNLSVELMPQMDVGMLISIGQLIITPAIIFANPLAGLIIDISGKYFPVFILGIVFSLIATLGFALLVREPRKHQVCSLKPISEA